MSQLRVALNEDPGDSNTPPTEVGVEGDVAKQLQSLMLRLKGEFMAQDGRGVNYQSLRESTLFKEYKQKSLDLKTVDVRRLNVTERKCFFINVYNALTIHGLAAREQLPSSVLDVANFWRTTCYNIGGHVYSLDDMEHGILRANRPHPSMSSSTYFEVGDPRSKFCLPELDPRIHFALVCGAKSCPPIQVYSPANMDRGLNAAAVSFCSQEVTVSESDPKVEFSKIFQWYARDFGENENSILLWILNYLQDDQKSKLDKLLKSGAKITLEAKDYDWMLNKL